MDAVREALRFLLREWIDAAEKKHLDYIFRVDDLSEDDPLRDIQREERDKVKAKLVKAKASLEALQN